MSKAEQKKQDGTTTPEQEQAVDSKKEKQQPLEKNDLQPKLDEMKDSMMRALAEAENTRRRAAKEIEEANKYGITSIAKDLIPILENLQRALDNTTDNQKKDESVKTLFEGVDLTKKELASIFERRGIKRIEPKPGEKFDHNVHQAVAQIEDHKFEPGAIIQVVQSGYIIHDRLLRPAMVAVSKGAPQAAPKVDTTA